MFGACKSKTEQPPRKLPMIPQHSGSYYQSVYLWYVAGWY